jgi:peptidoglycan/LPS O-acetylase OafA/YrhL
MSNSITKQQNNNINYFNGLNALRFFAAYFVVLHHAEQIRMKYAMFNWKQHTLFNNGSISVTFFFVLSGFLITYLLLKEQNNTGGISIKKFYTRRILRIWPLYFLLVTIGTIVIPFLLQMINYDYEMPYHFKDVILYYLFFAPFMVNILYGHHLLEALWSIGVEELFYIIWAPLFKFLKKHILAIIVSVILLKLILSLILNYIEMNNYIVSVIGMLKFEAMAIGGLGAYMVFKSKSDISKKRLFSFPVQVGVFLFMILYLFFRISLIEKSLTFKWLFSTPILSEYLLMAIFVWLIINVSLNPKTLMKLNNKYLNFLGEISYGIYMYHMIIVFGMVLIFKSKLDGLNNILSSAIFYTLLTASVIIVSYLSKKFFENYFLSKRGDKH